MSGLTDKVPRFYNTVTGVRMAEIRVTYRVTLEEIAAALALMTRAKPDELAKVKPSQVEEYIRDLFAAQGAAWIDDAWTMVGTWTNEGDYEDETPRALCEAHALMLFPLFAPKAVKKAG